MKEPKLLPKRKRGRTAHYQSQQQALHLTGVLVIIQYAQICGAITPSFYLSP
jgi:hypothetical protein